MSEQTITGTVVPIEKFSNFDNNGVENSTTDYRFVDDNGHEYNIPPRDKNGLVKTFNKEQPTYKATYRHAGVTPKGVFPYITEGSLVLVVPTPEI